MVIGGGPVRADDPNHTRIEGPRREADTSLGRAQLRRAAVADLGQVLEGETGLRVTRLGGLGAFSTVSVRGSTAEQVMVFLDGIPLGGADGAPVDLGTIPLGPLAGIDIYRGYTPARLGVPALAGAINLRARRLDALSAGAEVGAGSLSTRLVRAYAGGQGVTVHFDALGSAGDFRYVDDRGTRFTTSDDITRTRVNNGLAQYSGLVRGDLALTPTLSLKALYLGTRATRELPGLGVHPTQASQSALTRHVGGVAVDLATTPVSANLAAYVAATHAVVNDPLGELGPIRPRVARTGLVPGATLTVTYADADIALPWQAALHAAWRAEQMAGDGIGDATRDLLTLGLSGELAVPDAAIHVVGDVQLLAPLASDGDATRVPNKAGDSARLRIDWRAHRRHRLSLTGTRSFRLPSLYELYGDTGLVLGNAQLRPERAHGLELAWRANAMTPTETAPTAISFEVNTYARWHSDLIQFLQNAQNVARPENIASAFIAGVEVSGSVHHDDWFEARIAGTWLHTRDTSDIAARRGNELPLRPRFVANARVRLSPHPMLGLAVDVDYMRGNFLDAANLVMTDDRLLAGVHVYARVDDFKVILSCTNIFDSRVQDLAGFPLPGFTAFATLRWEPELL